MEEASRFSIPTSRETTSEPPVMERSDDDPHRPLPPEVEPPAGLTAEEYAALRPAIESHHRYDVGPGQCSSILAQRIRAPAATVWSVVRRFDRPQIYKHFVRSCSLKDGGSRGEDLRPGCLREVSIITGLPASTSTERLDLLDDGRRALGFTIIGGEHRLRNYRSVTTVDEIPARGDQEGSEARTVVLESYVVDVPEGNTVDDTKLFADTVVRLNLQKLASVTEAMAEAARRSATTS
ncbi:abscisic acid receptor PYR1-like [Canna indica]|uniref:Abscisic acid receptor PYR1-like n=1 Tax=Canna indica TaxID=4628 RepID=A0AAQ3QHD5_9LILI|nr:abscisic acid receptor PYR1-like [Canna indica]